MSHYADLSSLINLLEDVMCHHRYPNSRLAGLAIVKSLHEKLKFLQELLEDYSFKADNVKSQIRDVVCQAQDVIELEISHEIHSERPMKNIFSKLFFAFKSALPRQERTQKILQAVERKVSSIIKELVAIRESQRMEDLNCHSHDTATLESSSVGENTIMGFDKYLIAIKDQLCGDSSRLQVISITGPGGIGKTTLARTIFSDSLIMHHFDYRGWVTISQDYVVKRVLQNLTKSLGMASKDIQGDEGALKECIYKYLKGRRFFIVVDDIWSTQVWDDLKWIFPDDHKGSRIVLTSRLVDVAAYSGTSANHHAIQFLNNDDSWNLLHEKVFAGGSCPVELENTGKLIAKKCQGLPLAIVLIAGILSKTQTQNGWKRVATNLSSILNENADGLSRILSLSYNHLPHKLKACFLYFAIFPEDYEIRTSRLALLWIAEGFIELSGGSKSLEKVAEEYLQDLVNRNLVLVNKKKSSGPFKFCTVHDLVSDFCRKNAFNENFIHVISQAGHSWPRNVRRLNLHCYPSNWYSSITSRLVHSIIWYGAPRFPSNAIGGFKLLKILDLQGSRFVMFPEVICQLYHLKYLAFSNVNCFERLVLRSISNLQNLQTLIVSYGWICFPDEIWMMPRLRHLKIDHLSLPLIPCVAGAAAGGLEYLQTLSVVAEFIFTDEAIRMIPNILKLKIGCYNESSNQWNLYSLYNLIHLHRLEKLSISFRQTGVAESLPANFAFPLNLTKLCLRGCKLPWKDLTAVGSLPHLQVLKLQCNALTGNEWEPTEGEFCSLEFLLMEDLDLEYWLADNTHFPCLEHLVIKSCRNLEGIPLEVGNIPTLKVIEVQSGSRGVAESARQIQEEQLELGNDEIQVHVLTTNFFGQVIQVV